MSSKLPAKRPVRDCSGLALLLLVSCAPAEPAVKVVAPAPPPVTSAVSQAAATQAVPKSELPAAAASATLPSAAELERLRGELDRALKQQLLPFWYPRSVSSHGGFSQTITADGTVHDDGTRFLVFQARMTWVAAEVARRYPGLRAEYLKYTRHGLDFLRQKLWDDRLGGFYFELGADGKPMAEKHSYGIAFGIYACAAGARATGDAKDVAFAVQAFEWLDDHAHDSAHGGYYEALTRAGVPLLKAAKAGQKDGIGTEYGRKSMNAHIHVLEALSELYRVAPSERLRSRLMEVFLIVRDKVAAPDGHFHVYLEPDYRPITTGAKDSYGHNIEGAFLLLEAAAVLGMPHDAATSKVATALADHALSHGWDSEHHGLYNEGEAGGHASDLQKVWWVQAESLNGLLAVHAASPRPDPRYFEAFRQQWAFVKEHVIDSERGEWRGYLQADGKSADPKQDLATKWKAAYHSGRSLMYGAELLAQLGSGH